LSRLPSSILILQNLDQVPDITLSIRVTFLNVGQETIVTISSFFYAQPNDTT